MILLDFQRFQIVVGDLVGFVLIFIDVARVMWFCKDVFEFLAVFLGEIVLAPMLGKGTHGTIDFPEFLSLMAQEVQNLRSSNAVFWFLRSAPLWAL